MSIGGRALTLSYKRGVSHGLCVACGGKRLCGSMRASRFVCERASRVVCCIVGFERLTAERGDRAEETTTAKYGEHRFRMLDRCRRAIQSRPRGTLDVVAALVRRSGSHVATLDVARRTLDVVAREEVAGDQQECTRRVRACGCAAPTRLRSSSNAVARCLHRAGSVLSEERHRAPGPSERRTFVTLRIARQKSICFYRETRLTLRRSRTSSGRFP